MSNHGFDLPDHWPIITSLHEHAGWGKWTLDPLKAAREEAARINANREVALGGGLDRVLRDAPWVRRKDLLAGIAAYHRDAMSRIPSYAKHPESKPYVEHALTVERELRHLANLNDEEIALVKSMGPYLKFRGFKEAGLARSAPPRTERCRTVFLLNTDQGPFQIKNVDDPMPANYRPAPPLPARMPLKDFWWENVEWVADGVGSGLHLDDEPDETFPLPVLFMAGQHAHDTPGVVEFLRRYSPFWGGCNLLIFDRKLRAMAVEKCSHNFFEAFPPTSDGWCHVSGMACRDPNSPQARYQRAKRQQYRKLYSLPEDGIDKTFWQFCDAGEQMMVEGLSRLGEHPKVADVTRLFWTPYPGGLCKGGYRFHPDQPVTEYTMLTYATLFEKRRYWRWQRGQDPTVWPEQPEACQFA